jgi:hypothetical protein
LPAPYTDTETAHIGVVNGTLVARRGDRQLWYWTSPFAGQPPAAGWHSSGVTIASAPAAAAIPKDPENIFVFARTKDNLLQVASGVFWTATPALGPWSSLDKRLISGPVAISNFANTRSIVAGVGTDGLVWSRIYSNGQWEPWASHGHGAVGGLSVTDDTMGNFVIAGRGADQRAWVTLERADGSWNDWSQISPVKIYGTPCVTTWQPPGEPRVYEMYFRITPTRLGVRNPDGTSGATQTDVASDLSCSSIGQVWARRSDNHVWNVGRGWMDYYGGVSGDATTLPIPR